MPYPTAPSRREATTRILVRSLNWVGDAIMATPTISRLRQFYADAHITVMVRPWVAAIYEHNPDVDALLVVDDSGAGLWKAASRIQQEKFTLGIALPNSLRAALLLKLGGVPVRIGYARGFGRKLLLNRPVVLDPELLKVHQVYYYLGIIAGTCGKPEGAPRLTLNAGELERGEMQRLLGGMGLDRGAPLIGIAPGSINSNAKRWAPERFAALADYLGKTHGAQVLLLGSAKEQDVLERVAALSRPHVHNLAGKVTLGQLIALVERLQALVCNDSGAMHIGAAMGIPTVAVFGPTEWATTYPFSPRAAMVRKEGIDCAPCMLRECPIDHRCMTGVTIEMVAEKLEPLLAAGPAPVR